ncbi:MAG: hypothetical protein Crog4KO_18430 [Crocinitomicaceae bacterium]
MAQNRSRIAKAFFWKLDKSVIGTNESNTYPAIARSNPIFSFGDNRFIRWYNGMTINGNKMASINFTVFKIKASLIENPTSESSLMTPAFK